MNDDALVLENVVKRFGRTTAVDGMTFAAHRGEVLALLGPNGAGKSTTMDMCTGFTAPTSGEVRVLGINPATNPQQVRDRVGIMLQGGGAYSAVSVRDMLRLAASYNIDPHDPEWLIELLGLGGVADTAYRRLSGGQQQRLSLALAIIGRPELVFLDEPTAGLDTQSRHAVWELVAALRRDGVTVILTTHMMDEAEALSDQVVIVDRGTVVAQGTPAELTHATDTQVVTVVTAVPLDVAKLADALAPHHLTIDSPERPTHLKIRGAADPPAVSAIAAEAQRQGVLIQHLEVARRSLEDVFLDTTGTELRS